MQELRRGSSEKRDRRSFGGMQGDETDLNGFKKNERAFSSRSRQVIFHALGCLECVRFARRKAVAPGRQGGGVSGRLLMP